MSGCTKAAQQHEMKARLQEVGTYCLYLEGAAAFLDDTVQSSDLIETKDLKVRLKECFCLRMAEPAAVTIATI